MAAWQRANAKGKRQLVESQAEGKSHKPGRACKTTFVTIMLYTTARRTQIRVFTARGIRCICHASKLSSEPLTGAQLYSKELPRAWFEVFLLSLILLPMRRQFTRPEVRSPQIAQN